MIPVSPRDLDIDKESWRPHQSEIVNAVSEDGPAVSALCAPTGSGKSVIAVAAGRHLKTKTIILTSTKALQDQYAREFDIPKAIGRGNFQCTRFGGSADLAPCTWSMSTSACTDVGRCPYVLQRDAALKADMSVLNYPMFLGLFSNSAEAPKLPGLVVCDEGHNLEQALISFGAIEFKGRELPAGWAGWSRASDCATWARSALEKVLNRPRSRETVYLANRLRQAMDATNAGWILQTTSEGIRLRPLWGSSVSSALFTKAKKFLVMSATLMPSTLEACGLTSWAWHDMPSNFPPKNRPIYLWPVTKVGAKSTDDDYRKLAAAMDSVIAASMPAKGILHMASGRLQDRLLNMSKYGRLVRTHGTRDRLEVLEAFKQAPTGILASPSMMEGIDMPDDLLRWQVIPKTPFADLGDPVVAARAHDNRQWYTQDAIAKMIQAAGRGVRHKEDRCSTWILDTNALWLYSRNAAWWPRNIRDAVVRVRR